MLDALRRRGLVWPTVMTLVMLPMLVALGAWQLQRKTWKEGLIAAIEARSTGAPVDLATLLDEAKAKGVPVADLEYTRVRVSGTFPHDRELYVYAPDQQAGPGVQVLTPLELGADGRVVIVNRGYVPDARRAPSARSEGARDGPTEVVGLVRAPQTPGAFDPDNDTAANLWFWRDLPAMGRAAGIDPARQLPVFVDAEAAAPGGWPRGGATLVRLPNRHLEYALTWFGLAGALLAVYAAFVRSRWSGRQALTD